MGKKKGRSAGEGTVRAHASGLKEARLYIPKKLRSAYGGKTYLSFYGKTEGDALAKRAEAAKDLEDAKAGGKNLTVGSYLARWLETPAARNVAPRTYEDRKMYTRKYLIPSKMVGDVPLSDLDAEALDDLYGKLLAQKVGVRTINHVHATIRVALSHAVKKRLVSYNAARDADPPLYSTKDREYRTLSQEEVAAFFEALAKREDRLEAFFVAAVLAGPRPAELRALSWSDVKLAESGSATGEPGEMRIRRSVSETRERGMEIRNTTKTGKPRSIYLFPEVVSALRSHRARQNGERLSRGSLWTDQGLVFPNSIGGILSGQNITRRHFKPALEAANLPKEVRLYDLRHTFASLWLESGEDLKVLQTILGHSRIETTANLYVHVSDRIQRESFERFGERFRSKNGGS